MKQSKLDKVIKIVREMMALGGGGISSTIEGSNYDPNFTPPVNKKKKKPTILARGKLPGARKRWQDYINGKNGKS